MTISRPGLLILLKAKQGKQGALMNFLNEGLSVVAQEAGTQSWYAFQISEDRFGIYDTFSGENARQDHLSGELANALRQVEGELLAAPPEIRKIDVLAAKAV